MSDSTFLPSNGDPPFNSFPIVEDTDACKVIVLSPRGDGTLGLGCLFLLFFPAIFLSVPLVMVMTRSIEAEGWWLIVTLWLAAVAVPLGMIWYSRGRPLSETSLVLERHRVTLREEQFDRHTGESVSVAEEMIRIGHGSGVTDGEDMSHDAGEHIPFVIWGTTESLAISGLTKTEEVAWLRQEVSGWLRRHVVETPLAQDVRQHRPAPDNVSTRKSLIAKRRQPVNASLLKLPDKSQIELLRESADCFAVRVPPGGVDTSSLRWQAMWALLFMTGFTALWCFILRGGWDFGWGVWFALGLLWMVPIGLVIAAIRMSFETLQLELASERCVIQRTILLWTRRREFDLGASPAAFLKVKQWHGRRPIPTISIRGVDGTAEFGTMLSDQEKRWLVMRLRAFLKLDPRTSIFAEPEGPGSCPAG